MKYSALAVLLCALLSFPKAECVIVRWTSGMTHCQDHVDKTWHAVGSKWRNSHCWDCTCNNHETACVQGYLTPTEFPDDCVKVFDLEACEYIVHKRDDPSVICEVTGGVRM